MGEGFGLERGDVRGARSTGVSGLRVVDQRPAEPQSPAKQAASGMVMRRRHHLPRRGFGLEFFPEFPFFLLLGPLLYGPTLLFSFLFLTAPLACASPFFCDRHATVT